MAVAPKLYNSIGIHTAKLIEKNTVLSNSVKHPVYITLVDDSIYKLV